MIDINLKLPLEGVLEKFFDRELTQLIKKYTSIPKEMSDKLEKLLNNLPWQKYYQYIDVLDVNTILKLMEEENSAIEIYFWMKEYVEDNTREITVRKVKAYLRKLAVEGYVEIEDYVLVYDGNSLKEYTEIKLLELVQDDYHVDKFFDKDQLIKIWLKETSKEEAVRELMMIKDPHKELLDLDFEEICICEYGRRLLAAYKKS